MHFRAQKKLAGEVSLADSLDGDDDGSSLSLMDVIAVDDNMLEELDTRGRLPQGTALRGHLPDRSGAVHHHPALRPG